MPLLQSSPGDMSWSDRWRIRFWFHLSLLHLRILQFSINSIHIQILKIPNDSLPFSFPVFISSNPDSYETSCIMNPSFLSSYPKTRILWNSLIWTKFNWLYPHGIIYRHHKKTNQNIEFRSHTYIELPWNSIHLNSTKNTIKQWPNTIYRLMVQLHR